VKPFWIIDAFAAQAFAGNPAAVVLLNETWPDDDWLRSVAAEFNLAETSFVLEPGPGGARGLRWFTPTVEVPLCGHATMATAHALWTARKADIAAPLAFDTKSGRLACQRSADGRIAMDFPACRVRSCTAPSAVLLALGLHAIVSAAEDDRYLVIEVASEANVRAIAPDFALLANGGPLGVCVTARADRAGVDFVSRFFAPRLGVPEDPVTGSAHCRLGPYWADKLGRRALQAEQLSARGGRVGLDILDDRVLLSGLAVATAQGSLLC
jgi:PhzF family phenazine biosynthesis protein